MSSTPILLPQLGAAGEPVYVSCWLTSLDETVGLGEPVVEVLLDGVTFDVAAPTAGVLSTIARPVQAAVCAGDVLGWIVPDEQRVDEEEQESEA